MNVLWIIPVATLLSLAACRNCTNNFTSVEDVKEPPSSLNISYHDGTVRDTIPLFETYRHWVFPSMTFGCTANLSKVIVRANEEEQTSFVPRLFIWKQQENMLDTTIIYINTNFFPSFSSLESRIEYCFDPPVEVKEDYFIGLMFNNTEQNRPVAFSDVGMGNAPVSVQVNSLVTSDIFIEVQSFPVTRNISRFVPLITAEFAEEVVITAPPPTITLPTSTTPATSDTTSTPTTVEPPSPVVLDVGIIAGVAVAVLLVLLIVLLLILAFVVCRRSRAQQRQQKTTQVSVYEQPVEPLSSNLDNPVYGGERSQTRILTNEDATHIYATPSPTPTSPRLQPSPHPSHDSQLTFSVSGGAHHYEFAEGYLSNGTATAESHYEMEPGMEDPEYAQPDVNIQPYEIPLSALQASQRDSPPVPGAAENNNPEPIYSVLEEGIFVPTVEERKPYPYSEATIISETASQTTTAIYSDMGKKYKGSLTRDGFFEQADTYWTPASNQTALYDQLSQRKYREIVRHKIQIIKHLGSGQFGTVNMGVWTTSTDTQEVAVKTLQPNASEKDKIKFLQEAAIMGQFLHPNVVKLYGVVTVGEPVMIVLEFMEKGDLRNYLISNRPQPGEMVMDQLPQKLLRFCREISSGMNYLSNKSFVHRDLAARNVLLSSDCTCKIGDFGMSRDLEQKNYYITHGGIIPVKWTSPEALNFRKYSTASDVWSFGCVMYEIWSLGHKPFEGFTNLQCMQLVGSGFRLAPPPGCPRPLYELMIRCWHTDYSVRPMFSAIFTMLSHSPSHLLSWTERDLGVHPQAACLGAPLEVTEELYTELQDYYMISNKPRNKKGSNTADW